MPLWFALIAQAALLSYAMVGGVFLAFSDFIMRALSQLDGASGAGAMQNINREVFRWVFMTLFLGLAPVSLLLAGYGALWLGGTAGVLIALGGLVYLLGCFAVTVAANVPMNEALAAMDRSAPATQAYWSGTYLPRWTRWNSLRTLACALAAALLLAGLLRAGHPPA
jgi:uncharacterized membrane protein